MAKRPMLRWWAVILTSILMVAALSYSNGAIAKAVHNTFRAMGKWVEPSRMAQAGRGGSDKARAAISRSTRPTSTAQQPASSASELIGLLPRPEISQRNSINPMFEMTYGDASKARNGSTKNHGNQASGTPPASGGSNGEHSQLNSGSAGGPGGVPSGARTLPGTVKYSHGGASRADTANVPDTEWTIRALALALLMAMGWRRMSARPVL